ncbi:hypothetical protein PG996_015611 [Apiospora saccharicola]|uniref:Uncharacterized protein n=1 Tax=Apiospora saccharicola TaxID=335842 RepID=A0ABR1TLS9_9PEZI
MLLVSPRNREIKMRSRFDFMEWKVSTAILLAQVRRVGTQLKVRTRLCSTPDHTWILDNAGAVLRERVMVTSESIIKITAPSPERHDRPLQMKEGPRALASVRYLDHDTLFVRRDASQDQRKPDGAAAPSDSTTARFPTLLRTRRRSC